MRKLAWIAVAGALLALIVAVGFGVLGGERASAQAPLVMGIDLETTGNTCGPSPADCTLGPIESYYAVTCPSAECTWDGSSTFDGVADYIIDVYVDDPAGSVPAPIAYDAWVYYDETIVNIANSLPDGGTIDTDGKIKMPGADFGGGDDQTLPDSDGKFIGGWLFMLVTPDPGVNTYIGDGPVLRMGLDIGASGPVTFSFDEVPSAYISTAGSHDLTFQTAQLVINQALEVDLSVDSQVTSPPTDMDVSVNDTLHVDTTGTHTGLPLPDIVEVTVSHTVTAPGDCSVDGGAQASDSWTGYLDGTTTTSHVLSTDFTIHCAEPSNHVFAVENEIELLEPGYGDPSPANNTDTVDVSVNVWADSDIKINSFDVVYDRIIDSNGDTVPDLYVVDVSTPTDIIVRKVLHNNGPYGPTQVELAKTAAVVLGNAEVLPAVDTEQAILPVSDDVTVDETFTIHCYDSNVGDVAVFQFDNDVTIKDAHVVDPDGASDSTTFTVYCALRFTPTFSATIDEDDATMNPPVDDVCVVGLPCKSMTSVAIPDDVPKQPLALIQTVYPAALDIANGTATTNGHTVGKSDFWVTFHVQGLTPGCVAPLSGTAVQYDAALPSEGTSSSLYALFPGSGDCSGPGQECGFVYWAQQLDAMENFVQTEYPGAVLWARYVGTTGPPLNIPVNTLVWNLGPSGWLAIVGSLDPDDDLDGLWDEVLDADNDNDGIPDNGGGSGSPRDNPCTGGATANCDDNCQAGPGYPYPSSQNADQADADSDGVGDVCDLNPSSVEPHDPQTFFCSPFSADTLNLGETQNPSGEILRTCEAYGTHPVTAILIREDTGEATLLYDTITCLATETDVKIVDSAWNFPDDIPGISGIQRIVVPSVGEVITSTEVLHNNGGTHTDPVDVDDDRDAIPGAGCTVSPTSYSDSYNLPVGVTQSTISDDWTVTWTQVGKPPYTCTITFDKDVSITTVNVSDSDLSNNTKSVPVVLVLDTDGDGVPDDGDLSGDDADNPCDTGETALCDDNCEADVNPGQEDNEGDGLGDVCDDDDDDDGFTDDQENSLGSDPLNVDSTPEHISLPSTCTDGIDNDLDGLPDLFDCDTDGDGIANYFDACPFTTEDMDGHQDDDGCLDADNDMDGVCDPWAAPSQPACTGSDDCPNVPEDVDSFHDTDGCPDPDNDGDGLPDSTDFCPGTDWTAGPDGIPDNGDEPLTETEPPVPMQTKEDYDGVIDWDGCHDSPGDDWDSDGITDEDEVFLHGSDPTDMDTDNDGLCDGHKLPLCASEDANNNGIVDPGETDPTNGDTDGDGLSDGLESGLTAPETPDTDPSSPNWQPDADPTSTTDPLNADSDGDGIDDGAEDPDQNGRVDPGETAPDDDDTDDDEFLDAVELYLETDPTDACPDGPSDDAWPLDMDMNGVLNLTGDASLYPGEIGCNVSTKPECKRLDLDMSGVINLTGDAIKYVGRIGESCT